MQSELGGPSAVAAEKIKILYNKKPVPASKKTVGDVVESEDLKRGKTVELGVMIMGGAPDPPAKLAPTLNTSAASSGVEEAAEAPIPTLSESMEGIEKVSSPPPVQGPIGKEILETDAFWTDLQGFLEQRTKDEAQAAELIHRWKNNWETD